MPRYDYLCEAGHTVEERHGFNESRSACSLCGAPARVVVSGRSVLIGGSAIPPMRERGIPLDRAVNAHSEMVRQAERAGVSPPDVLGAARRQAAAIRRHAPELVTGT